MGEVVRIAGVSRDRRWWRVENLEDGYQGWVRTWGMIPVTARDAARWRRKARARVVVSYTEVRSGTVPDALVSPLFWNSLLIAGRARAGRRRVVLPDGRSGWVPSQSLGGSRPPGLIARVRSLLGVPYLWGGRTPSGFDCSGFTQQVLAEQGIRLPRDADQQFHVSRSLPDGEEAKLGDLIFFGPPRARLTHVGLCLGGGFFAHASGEVRISSIDLVNTLRDKELERQFRGVRRPGKGLSRRPESTESA